MLSMHILYILPLLPNYFLQEGLELPSLLLSETELPRIRIIARNDHNARKIKQMEERLLHKGVFCDEFSAVLYKDM